MFDSLSEGLGSTSALYHLLLLGVPSKHVYSSYTTNKPVTALRNDDDGCAYASSVKAIMGTLLGLEELQLVAYSGQIFVPC